MNEDARLHECEGCDGRVVSTRDNGLPYALCGECERLAGVLFALWARIDAAVQEVRETGRRATALASTHDTVSSRCALLRAEAELTNAAHDAYRTARAAAQTSSSNGRRADHD